MNLIEELLEEAKGLVAHAELELSKASELLDEARIEASELKAQAQKLCPHPVEKRERGGGWCYHNNCDRSYVSISCDVCGRWLRNE